MLTTAPDETTYAVTPPPTERLTFRHMTLDDLDLVEALLGDPVVMAHYPAPKSRRDVDVLVAALGVAAPDGAR